MDKHGALISVCCCEDEDPCFQLCTYIAIDNGGTLEWQFVSNSPDPDCSDTGECGCLSPEIEPECEGQGAGCVCLPNSQSDDPGAPNCVYELCGPPTED
jgi:hypothetical protein